MQEYQNIKFDGFKKEGTKFLENLKVNNTKVWFETNRHIWEKTIQTPCKDFVQDMGETLQILVPSIKFNAKVSGSLFKIYRDVRFSKDKTPMKSKIGLLFWQGETHRMQSSSFYMHFDKDDYFLASGIRNFKPELLKIYREYIKDEKKREELHFILEELKSKGYKLPKPKYKRMPKIFDFKEDEKYTYLAFYGAMFSYLSFKLDDVFYKVEFLDKSFNIYNDMKQLQQWVYEMTLQ